MTRLPDDVIAHLRDVAAWPELPSDRYVLRSLVGRGGMGAVYRAFDKQMNRDVAIKVSNAPGPGSNLDARLRLESRVLAELEHPGIVPVHDAGELPDGRWFYVMKLVGGRTLQEHVATLGGEAPILGVFERVVETVAFAHTAGIVHRDLKPSNIMIGSFGEVLVLDWGAARILQSAGARPPAARVGNADEAPNDATSAGTRIGTPGFMAPEQQRGDVATAGPPADVYALGALLSWMLESLPGTPPKRLRALIDKCTALAPADRYPHAADLAADLARYRTGSAVLAHPESALERAGRWLGRYRTFVLLVAAYLVMRAIFAWMQRG